MKLNEVEKGEKYIYEGGLKGFLPQYEDSSTRK